MITRLFTALGQTIAGGFGLGVALFALLMMGGGAVGQGAIGGGGGGVSVGLANTLYCQLAGCTMTGSETFSGVTTDITTVGSEDLALNAAGSGAVLLQSNGSTRFSITANTAVLRTALTSGTTTAGDAGSGTCTTVTVTGTALDFAITATCTAAQTVAVSFGNAAFGASPRCIPQAANAAAGAVTTGSPYQSAGTSTSATFTFPAVTAGTYNVHCLL